MAAIGFEERFSKFSSILFALLIGLSIWSMFKMTTSGFTFPGGRMVPKFNPAQVFGVAIFSWLAFLSIIIWLDKSRKSKSFLIILSAMELTFFYYIGPTRWGMSLDLPDSSPTLTQLKSAKETIMLAGPLENIPVTAGIKTAGAYFGVTMPQANESLKAIVELANQNDRQNRPSSVDEPLARLGVTHQLQFRPDPNSQVFEDNPLHKIILGSTKSLKPVGLRKLETANRIIPPKAWLARGELEVVSDQKAAFELLFDDNFQSKAPVLKSQISDEIRTHFANPDTLATLETGPQTLDFQVNHTGPAIVVIKRTFDSGWIATNQSGDEFDIIPVFGGLQGVFIKGDSDSTLRTSVQLKYSPKSLRWSLPIAASGVLILIWISTKNQA